MPAIGELGKPEKRRNTLTDLLVEQERARGEMRFDLVDEIQAQIDAEAERIGGDGPIVGGYSARTGNRTF